MVLSVFYLLLLLSKDASSQYIVIEGPESGPPKYYQENGTARGFIVDITRWVLDDIGHTYSINLLPWKRAFKNASSGNVGIIGLSLSTERLKDFDYSDPLFIGELVIVVKKGKEFPYVTIQDLAGKRIGVRRGTSYGDQFDEAVKQNVFHATDISKFTYGLNMTLENRLDAVILGPGKVGLVNILAMDEKLQLEQFSILPTAFKKDAKYLAFHKSMKMAGFLREFNRSLKKAKDTGVVDQIVNQYID